MNSPEKVPRETGGTPIPIEEFKEDPREFLATRIHINKVDRWLASAKWFESFSFPEGVKPGDFEAQHKTSMRIGGCGEHILIETIGETPFGKWQTLIIQKPFPGNANSSIARNFVLDEATSSYVKIGQEEA